MNPTLGALRACFEGAVPSTIATCAPDGTPNVTYLSHVHYVDEQHVALSFQFFNKTREDILANSRALVQVVDPNTAAHYRLHLEYLRTEAAGPLFENMKAKLAAIASHTGMSKVFRLLGSDLYRVLRVEAVPGDMPSEVSAHPDLLSGLCACLAGLAGCADLAHLLEQTLLGLEKHCDIRHSMLLMLDPNRDCLYTVASRGYSQSGVGSEIRVGEGIIGVAARERTPIRIGYAVQEYRYSHATRESFARSNDTIALETAIPFPGLSDSCSQLAVPLVLGRGLLGVLYVESPQELRFTYADEDALAIELLSQSAEPHDQRPAAEPRKAPVEGAPIMVRHFAVDHSVFVDNDYLIKKGVAGVIIWKLLCDYVDAGRTEFSNRELRLDPALRLPDVGDNLEARLILLQRRLAERCKFLRVEKTGRGRFRLNVARPIKLNNEPSDSTQRA